MPELPKTAIEIDTNKEKNSFCTCGKSKKLPYCDNSHQGYNEKTKSHYRSFKLIKQNGKMYVSSSNWEK